MKDLTSYIGILFLSFLLVFALVPVLRYLAFKIGLHDAPNARKVHVKPVPLIGGLAIVLSASGALFAFSEVEYVASEFYAILAGSIVLLVMGVIDDRIQLNAVLKLSIQLILAGIVINSGVKVESLFGIMGINALPEMVQNALTLVIIVGVINAFNLMDGIDGLAAGVAILSLSAFSVVAIFIGKYTLLVLFTALIGALLGFLRFNLSRTKKIFMGDAGSLVFGYILVVSGIILIQTAHQTSNITMTLSVVIGVLCFPVADSLRVYRKRIKNGLSPFTPDKTHFHHLILNLGYQHKIASLLIVFIAFGLIAVSILFGSLFSMTFTVISILGLFGFLSSLAETGTEIGRWKENIKKLEDFKQAHFFEHKTHTH